ncbi:MAG: hypothetical protein K0Q47_1314 [Sedimentibacter sp.]|jgi:hypothetical protein|nr:hypothetical protein [Sedimentibacter sp.]
MNNNYKIVRTIFENVFQRVLECKDNDSGEMFYSNVITSQKVINLIDIEELKAIPSNILESYNTEDRIYIYTKPLKNEFTGLREYSAKNLTLKHQFNLAEKVIELAQNIFNMTDVVQQKILDLDRLYVDENDKVVVDCNLIFEQEYDIADNETFKRLGNMIHYIFSGTEIVDYNISDTIPPDILKIIVRCLTREYIFPRDVLAELKSSPIFAMIFGTETVAVSRNPHKTIIQDDEPKPSKSSTDVFEEDKSHEETLYDKSIFDIYVNDNNPKPRKKIKTSGLVLGKEIKRAVISIVIVVLVLIFGNMIIKNLNNPQEVSADENNGNTQNEQGEKPSTDSPVQKPDDTASSISDSTEMYFNDQLIEKTGYTGEKVKSDGDIYVEGKNSLVAANDSDGKLKSLFAVVDFTDEKFSYMLKKQIGISAKTKSEKDVDALIVLESYKGGVLTSNFHTSVKVYDDMWSQVTVPINVTDADSLNIYIEYEGQNKVWIDSVFIDVMK